MSTNHHSELQAREYRLRNRLRHLRRLRWAARSIDDTTAANAYAAFADPDDDVELELAIGRLLVLLDRHVDLESEA